MKQAHVYGTQEISLPEINIASAESHFESGSRKSRGKYVPQSMEMPLEAGSHQETKLPYLK